MTGARGIARVLRRRILGWLHQERVNPGDRLPSIRRTAAEMGVDHRTVARAYRELEREGLVEVRERSGVFVAPQDHLGPRGDVLGETADWVASVATWAWTRRIPLQELPGLIERCVAGSARAVLVDSAADFLDLVAGELEEDFGLAVTPFPITGGYDRLEDADEERLRGALADADLVATSIFHTRAVERIAGGEGVPVVALRLNPEWVSEVARRLTEETPTTLVTADGRFADRLLDASQIDRDDVRAMTTAGRAEDGDAGAGRVLFTDLANPDADPDRRLLAPRRSPILAPDSARTLNRFLVRIHLEG